MVADTHELTCADPSADLSVFNSVSAAKKTITGDMTGVVKSAVTVFLPEVESCDYYRLTDGQGYISSQHVGERGWDVASIPNPEVRLKGLVEQCEMWILAALPYRPVYFYLPGPGPTELKVALPVVSHCPNNYRLHEVTLYANR